jgi:hypothetical protein
VITGTVTTRFRRPLVVFVIIWVLPPGVRVWELQGFFDFLRKKSIVRHPFRNAPTPAKAKRQRIDRRNSAAAVFPGLPVFSFPSASHCAVKPGHPSSSNRDYAEYPHLYRGGVKHDADHGAERLGGEVLLELSANDTRVAWRTISDALFPNYISIV